MTTTPDHLSDVPLPAGATTDSCGWQHELRTGYYCRVLTWREWDDVEISGWQYQDGSFSRGICVWLPEGKQLTSAEARQLARVLIAAADELDRLAR